MAAWAEAVLAVLGRLDLVSSVAIVVITFGTAWLFVPAVECAFRKRSRLNTGERFRLHSGTEEPAKILLADASDKGSVFLSVVVPAYNEELRLGRMLDETITYLERRRANNTAHTYEIIVVNDGSKDGTERVAFDFMRRVGTNVLKVLRLVPNQGKGAAIRKGAMVSRGKFILMADADAATNIEDLEKLHAKFAAPSGEPMVVVGSRAHLEQQAIASRAFHRNILMHGFHALVYFLCNSNVRDTQCGFKLFNREAARELFLNQHIDRWAFDVELLYRARLRNFTIAEVAVRWEEIDGTKLTLRGTVSMAREILLTRIMYTLRLWY